MLAVAFLAHQAVWPQQRGRCRLTPSRSCTTEAAAAAAADQACLAQGGERQAGGRSRTLLLLFLGAACTMRSRSGRRSSGRVAGRLPRPDGLAASPVAPPPAAARRTPGRVRWCVWSVASLHAHTQKHAAGPHWHVTQAQPVRHGMQASAPETRLPGTHPWWLLPAPPQPPMPAPRQGLLAASASGPAAAPLPPGHPGGTGLPARSQPAKEGFTEATDEPWAVAAC